MGTYCGIVLNGEPGSDCAIAFLTDDSVETISTPDDEDLVELIEQYQPSIVALNAPPEEDVPVEHAGKDGEKEDDSVLDPETTKQFRQGEKELIDEGHSLLPQGMRNQKLLERAVFLSNTLQRSHPGITIIESNPALIAERLDIAGDARLEAYGIDTDSIDTVWEFDAVMLALTARLYDEDRCEDHDIVLPESPDA